MTNKVTPAKLLPFFKPTRYKVLKGGRGGMKSHTAAEFIIERCLGTNPNYSKEPVRVVCLREVQQSIKDSVKQLLEDKISEVHAESYFTPIDTEIRCKNGSTIIFKGLQSYNSTNIKSLEGMDVAWVEEAQSISHKSLRMLRPTIRKPGSELIFTYNPQYPTDAIDEFVDKNPPDNMLVVNISWRDNPYLPEELVKEIEHDYQVNPAIASHIWEGGYEIITEGSYYGNLLGLADAEVRISEITYDPAVEVYASMDLGIGDSTAIWVFQIVGREWHWLQSYENRGQPLWHYVEWLNNLPYKIRFVLVPPDAAARELQSGKSRVQFLEDRGVQCLLLEKSTIDDGIAAVRSALPKSWFDVDGCREGLASLRRYRSEFSKKSGIFKPRPLHDEHSHYADAFRYAVMGENMLGGGTASRIFQGRSDWTIPIARDTRGTYV